MKILQSIKVSKCIDAIRSGIDPAIPLEDCKRRAAFSRLVGVVAHRPANNEVSAGHR